MQRPMNSNFKPCSNKFLFFAELSDFTILIFKDPKGDPLLYFDPGKTVDSLGADAKFAFRIF